MKSTINTKNDGWSRVVVLVALTLLTAIDVMQAQTQTYSWSNNTGTGYNGNWSTNANWTGTVGGVSVGSVAPVSSSTTSIMIAATSANRVINMDYATMGLSTLTITSYGAYPVTISGGTFQFYGASVNTAVITSGTGPSGNGQLQTVNNAIQMMGDGQVLANYASLTLGGGIDLNGKNLQFNAASPGVVSSVLRINGVISDSAASTSNCVYFSSGLGGTGVGAGSVIISGSNTYTGGTTLLTGNVIVANNNAFGAATSEVTLGSTSSTSTISMLTSGAITMNRNFRASSNTTTTNLTTTTIGGSTADNSTFSGNVTLNSTGTAGTQVAQSLTVTATNSGRVDFTGNIQRDSAAKSTASDNVTKTGAGIVALSGSANNYLGTTSVSAGVLLVDGTLTSGGGAVTVGSGATLGGTGTINRAVSVVNNGILSAGEMSNSLISQAGTLTLGGDLALSSASQLNFNLGSSKDLISITGNLTLDGVLNVSQDAGFGVGTYRLFDYTGTLTDNGLTVSLSGYTGVIDTSVANQVNLIVTVPEPSEMAMLCGGLILLLGWNVRRRWSLCEE